MSIHLPSDEVTAALDARSAQLWRETVLAVRVFAIAGHRIGGILAKARAGGVRDHVLTLLATMSPVTRLPVQTGFTRLAGGIDLAATAACGRIVREKGLLALANGGQLVIPMAEKLDPGLAVTLAFAMDTGVVAGQGKEQDAARFAVVALDEGDDTACVPTGLADRLGLRIDLDGIAWHHAGPVTLSGLPNWDACRGVTVVDAHLAFLSTAGLAAGAPSVRRFGHLVTIARVLAAMSGRTETADADVMMAARLALGISPVPPPAHDEPPQGDNRSEPPPARQDGQGEDGDGNDLSPDLADFLVTISRQVAIEGIDLSPGRGRSRAAGGSGKAGLMATNTRRGRAYSIARRAPHPDARPDIVATLRAAAPWQALRRLRDGKARTAAHGVAGDHKTVICRDDFRYLRKKHAIPSTAIFIVDASGSTAMERLGEAKGAIELLLAKCYVRRDEVGLIAFRGLTAQTVVEPTRSLVLAKRLLAGLPGGGPTPLASGLLRGLEMALATRRAGKTPILVLLTDGSGNIALDGEADRARARCELDGLAARCRSLGIKSLCIDVSRRPRPALAELAGMMAADYHILRGGGSKRLADIVHAGMQQVAP